ncbi:MAG: hypothetical protein HYV07_26945 [Deltaproteobacteria bacterium]|nr:hypothetical protein [Deltaproteobacteria bacterium]
MATRQGFKQGRFEVAQELPGGGVRVVRGKVTAEYCGGTSVPSHKCCCTFFHTEEVTYRKAGGATSWSWTKSTTDVRSATPPAPVYVDP